MEPNQSSRVVVTRTTVTVETRTSTNRWQYSGMSEDEIIDYETGQEPDIILEDFVRDVESTPHEKLEIKRTVEIVDKDT